MALATRFALLATLAACAQTAPVDPVPRPAARPERPPAPEPPAPEPERSRTQDPELVSYYDGVQRSLVAQGLLRTDGGGPDTPYDVRQLVENFVRIALYEEYATVSGQIVARQTASQLHRWEMPIDMQIEIGEAVPPAKQTRDRNAIISYANRLSRVSGHPIRQVEADGNYHVFVVTEEERRALGPQLRTILPGISDAAIRTVTELPRTNYCLVFALDPANSGAYTRAVAIIRAEHPDLLRLSCIHEELAQGMGLSNDSPSARPSVFNDDEEFGLLTTHDEQLLKMLYDPRMRPGMGVEEAREVATEIAREILGTET
ncbi:DUF2927 domain-containing protein [Tranquillimonas rosea]|uniref:DUF2927 domain-containing protein n=1 Tax=Tranquillimonas rosea TaxID=641238 RepID=UPI003BAC7961